MTRSITSKLFATAAVSALLSCSPVVTDAHAFGGEAQDIWHGLYLGGHVGWAWIDSDLAFRAPGAFSVAGRAFDSNLGDDDFAGGLQAGLNHQMGMLVVGLEADITFLSSRDKVTFLPGLGISADLREDFDYVGTIRGRVGAAVGNAFLYFTGGYAFGRVDHEIEQQAPGVPSLRVDDQDVGTGYALGGGGEFHLGTILGVPMSAKVEYLYIDLDETTVSIPVTAFVATTTQFEHDIQQVRVGVNVQLGGMLY